MATKAAAVAKVPTFVWLDTAAKVPLMGTFLANIRALNLAGASPPVAGTFVVYDLPDRDCAAAASNGEYTIADNGVAYYYAYIDAIKALLVTYSDVKVILVIEPDSLANLVTNLSVAKCANAEAAYKQCIEYAISTLNLPNVSMYLDAGHAGWLGWAANIGPAATLFAQVWQAAGSPAQVRGLATNVANYNAWSISPCPSYTSGDSNCDEEDYVNALAPLLTTAGFPAHFITDTCKLLKIFLRNVHSRRGQPEMEFSLHPSLLGVIGVTSLTPDLAFDPRPTLATLSRMLLSGSNQVENVT